MVTIITWDTKDIIEVSGPMANVQLDAFLDDVNAHYEKLTHNSVLADTNK